jgi:hypothetical protein
MIKIEFPEHQFNIRGQQGAEEIFDGIRKKWLLLSPEEWVRQNIIQFLLAKQYPASLIAVEKEIKLGELAKRCDIVVYSRHSLPFMIIECKEMNKPVSQKTLEQVLRYHITLPAEYLVITNGSFCYGFRKVSHQFYEIDDFPRYPQ